MPCFECEQAISQGYAYWCSICYTFIPSIISKKEPCIIEEETTEQSPPLPLPDDADTQYRSGIILLNSKGEVLLVRGPTGKLSLPKGKRKVRETDYEGACRECLEESGVDVRGMPIIRKQTIQGVVYFYVRYTGSVIATLGCMNSSEIHEVKWWKVLNDTIKNVKEITGDIKPNDLLEPGLLDEYMKKRCNYSLDTLLKKPKFYMEVLGLSCKCYIIRGKCSIKILRMLHRIDVYSCGGR